MVVRTFAFGQFEKCVQVKTQPTMKTNILCEVWIAFARLRSIRDPLAMLQTTARPNHDLPLHPPSLTKS